MMKSKLNLSSVLLVLMLVLGSASKSKAEIVELKGKVIQLASGMPATAILHSTADESYVGTANIDKDGNFSFKVDVPKAGQFNIRIMRLSYDVMLSAAEEVTNLTVKFDGDVLKDIEVEKSPENEAYKTFKTLVNLYDTKIIAHFRFCSTGRRNRRVAERLCIGQVSIQNNRYRCAWRSLVDQFFLNHFFNLQTG